MANLYKNAGTARLSDYIQTDRFRTVLPEHRHAEGGISEIPVEIHMKPPFAEKLSFYVPWDGIVYGYVRGKNDIIGKLGGFSGLKHITINDWDDKFLMVFESGSETDERAFFVSGDEIFSLLENCRRVPEQASIK